MRFPASAWSFRIGWAPVTPGDSLSTIVRYQVQLTCVKTGTRHAFYTPDDLPSIVLANREVREKVGDAFTVQIRVLRSDAVGEWSEASEEFSVAKSSPNLSLALASALPQPSLAARKKPALDASPYTDTKKAPAKKCEEELWGVVQAKLLAKRQRSKDRVAPKFHRPMATAPVKERAPVYGDWKRVVEGEDAAGLWDFFAPDFFTPKFRRPNLRLDQGSQSPKKFRRPIGKNTGISIAMA